MNISILRGWGVDTSTTFKTKTMEEPTMYVRIRNKQLIADKCHLQAENTMLKEQNKELILFKKTKIFKFLKLIGFFKTKTTK